MVKIDNSINHLVTCMTKRSEEERREEKRKFSTTFQNERNNSRLVDIWKEDICFDAELRRQDGHQLNMSAAKATTNEENIEHMFFILTKEPFASRGGKNEQKLHEHRFSL